MKITARSIAALLLILGGVFGGAEVSGHWAHASTLESQPTHSTLDSANCNSFDCSTFVGSKGHTETLTSTTNWGTLSTAYISFYWSMDGGSWGSYVTSPTFGISGTGCTLSGTLSGADLTAFKASSLSSPILFSNLPLTGSCTLASGSSYTFHMEGGNINGQMASYTDGSGAHTKDYFVLTDNGSPTPPAPSGDANPFTHVIRVTQPGSYATTTNTFPVSFDIAVNASTTLPNAYTLTYVNQLTRATKSQSGYLVDTGWTGQPLFTVATSSTLSGSGTYSMTIDLFVGSSHGVQGGRFTNDVPDTSLGTVGSRYSGHVFSVNAADNVTVLNSENGGWTNSVTYASTSCNILANFGADFSVGDCVGLLITPASTTMQKFSLLTLANSFPFAYAYQLGELRGILFGDATTSQMATTSLSVPFGHIGTVTLISKTQLQNAPLAAFIKWLIALTFWFMLAELIYYQVIRSHDKNTPV